MSEEIIGVAISTATGEKTLFSGLTNVHCRLIFTTVRLVVQRTVSQMRENYPNMRTDPQMINSLRDGGLEKILAENSQNLSIPYSEIVKVEVGRRWLNPRMNIITHNETHMFSWFWPQVGVNSVERMVRSLFPARVLVERAKKI